ncbi:MAG: SDR family oxidoreductase, partial [Fulvivirga sp.]|nr:SDR family oxidoreductase [Fulvivirga sp.]
MKIDLKGKIILVTGASRGIGKAIAVSLAQSGATVAIHCNRNIDQAEEIARDAGNNSQAFAADLSKDLSVAHLFERVISTYGRLDVLINNAGIAISSALSKADDEWIAEWQKTMCVNLTAVGLLCKKAIEHFNEKGGGIIINISSRAAFRGDTAEYFAYAASKGGMVALTKSIARAFGKQ